LIKHSRNKKAVWQARGTPDHNGCSSGFLPDDDDIDNRSDDDQVDHRLLRVLPEEPDHDRTDRVDVRQRQHECEQNHEPHPRLHHDTFRTVTVSSRLACESGGSARQYQNSRGSLMLSPFQMKLMPW